MDGWGRSGAGGLTLCGGEGEGTGGTGGRWRDKTQGEGQEASERGRRGTLDLKEFKSSAQSCFRWN